MQETPVTNTEKETLLAALESVCRERDYWKEQADRELDAYKATYKDRDAWRATAIELYRAFSNHIADPRKVRQIGCNFSGGTEILAIREYERMIGADRGL